ncbi:hypothetical protein [Kribbella sp. HUAS MG21]|uniref:DUF2269 family protein n=1 Tax=Kribbella sp. HUAS MG21 TaxID=3160966 RepID=A0AAU7T6K1_9ACTN
MTAFLLSVHVLAAILAVGPVAIAASMFPPAAGAAHRDHEDARKAATVQVLHRITRVYATIAIFVPVFGLATGARLGVLGDAWLIASMILTAAAAVVLIALILPGQSRFIAVIGVPGNDADALRKRLAMQTGIFNLLWAVVVVLMIYRPGSTTGVGL